MRLTCILALLASAICTHRSLLFGGIEPASETSVSAELQSLRRQREELTKENNRLRALKETNAVPCLANSTTSKPEDLFVQRAPSCHFTHGDTGTRIVFDDMSGVTSRFTDRPYRKTSRIGTLEFFESYDSLFGQDLPNGAIMMMDVDGTEKGPYITTMAAERVDETFVYLLTQSSDQTNDADIDSIPGNTSFENCVIFIDDALELDAIDPQTAMCGIGYSYPGGSIYETLDGTNPLRCWTKCNEEENCLFWDIDGSWNSTCRLRTANSGGKKTTEGSFYGSKSCYKEWCGKPPKGYSYPGGSIYETLYNTNPVQCWTKCNEEENCLFWDIEGSRDSTCRLRTANSGGKVVTEGSSYGPKGCFLVVFKDT